ncbi:GNAT family N-acetyltransferase [Fredinandcohnia sp. 179-A 10B2 NHS]|uniref:GNAT family N-acetyltransferase n=1 Tax=Fredinandcohnia sp. 179-A 10B2 NHS TaxID=3235176 RepID=UPI00399F9999
MKFIPWDVKWLPELVKLWNLELGTDFPMREELIQQNSFQDHTVLKSASHIAINDDKMIVGFIVAKKIQKQMDIQLNTEVGWIQVLLVHSDFRNKGIGSALLTKAEDTLKNQGSKTIFLGRDPGHYFPGVPVKYETTKRWFEHKGYQAIGIESDLVRNFKDDEIEPVQSIKDIQISLVKQNEQNDLLSFLHHCFPGRWEYEAAQYFENGGTGREFVIFKKNNQIIGFCRINDSKSPIIGPNVYWSPLFHGELGGIGPLGIDSAERKNGYGLAIVKAGIAYLRGRQIDSIVIDWTGLVDFYQKLNFTIWKQYQQYSKNI